MSFDVPDACTLPTTERPLRRAEFEELFSSAAHSVERVGPTHARIRLAGPTGLEAAVRDLTAREAACCSFFTFATTAHPGDDGEVLTLDVEVPARYAEILAALADRAERLSA